MTAHVTPVNQPRFERSRHVYSDVASVRATAGVAKRPIHVKVKVKVKYPRRDEVTGEWRRLHNEELNDLYSSPNIVRVIKSRRMRWAGHVPRMGEERGRIGSWWGNRRARDHWGDLGVDGWIILGWISRRWEVGMWTGLGWHRIGTGGGRL